MNIINAYNENGIYFLFDSTLWWFNGKRFENWCYCPHIRYLFVYNSKLYGKATCNKIHILENQQFKYHGSMEDIIKTKNYVNPWSICLDDNHNFYFYSRKFGTFKNGEPLPNKTHPFAGLKLFYYDGFLYHFGCGGGDDANEKFDLQKKQWSVFATYQVICNINDIYLLNDLFYILFTNGKIETYNPKTNMWHRHLKII